MLYESIPSYITENIYFEKCIYKHTYLQFANRLQLFCSTPWIDFFFGISNPGYNKSVIAFFEMFDLCCD